MIMRDSEIKTLFAKADEQVHIDEIRKQKTYYAMIEEMEKQRTPMMSTKNILLHQFWYMDKLFCAVLVFGSWPLVMPLSRIRFLLL